ncbi:hypothetical protein [Streptomyces lonegramiae]|uniref:Uncharacterized protein n=1 Tax=Streptomyces lonegramiae TaxID=3075524 RepID=A0ABU2XTQ8_9ACTN|nr:hypothetical protein [Streptomyces sp. DSM 41529]MDT0549305.1 hypothetical protein [Streptomyces sp. DSM 41529]
MRGEGSVAAFPGCVDGQGQVADGSWPPGGVVAHPADAASEIGKFPEEGSACGFGVVAFLDFVGGPGQLAGRGVQRAAAAVKVVEPPEDGGVVGDTGGVRGTQSLPVGGVLGPGERMRLRVRPGIQSGQQAVGGVWDLEAARLVMARSRLGGVGPVGEAGGGGPVQFGQELGRAPVGGQVIWSGLG